REQQENGLQYNIYTAGLKIYTTLDYKMQQLAEKSMQEHMEKLQNSFEKSYGKRAPWETDKKLIKRIIERSEPYIKLKNAGLDPKQIMDSLQLKKELTLGDWKGDSTIIASTVDSILHYSKFLNTGSLSLDPATGAVKTWIGGINFR